ncbi:hypothetical protein ACGTN9_10710 [Halobacillus sp. MO56]
MISRYFVSVAESGVRAAGKWWREIGISTGEQVDITFHQNDIFIEKANPESPHNKRYVTETNAINIPKEIEKELRIEPYQPYSLYIDRTHNRFVISLEQEEEAYMN